MSPQRRTLIIACAMLFIAALGYRLFQPSLTPDPSANDEPRAIRLSKAVIKTALEYPLDAEFGWNILTDVNELRNSWVVAGTVKAPNAFGARLTQEWTCLWFVDTSNGDRDFILIHATIGGDTFYESPEFDKYAKLANP